jgi:hypothetical protein
MLSFQNAINHASSHISQKLKQKAAIATPSSHFFCLSVSLSHHLTNPRHT